MKDIVFLIAIIGTIIFIIGSFFDTVQDITEIKNTNIDFSCDLVFNKNDSMPINNCTFLFRGNPNQVIKILELIGELKEVERNELI